MIERQAPRPKIKKQGFFMSNNILSERNRTLLPEKVIGLGRRVGEGFFLLKNKTSWYRASRINFKALFSLLEPLSWLSAYHPCACVVNIRIHYRHNPFIFKGLQQIKSYHNFDRTFYL